MKPDFDNMNETDVREIIVRPLLARLGYAHGTQANIRTEVRLTYDRAFLGRKNPSKDPPLAGRADYICEVISYGRWTVEVKAPSEPLSQDDVEQAHTYSAHPQIAASHFLLTNGREFRLYAIARLDEPILAWSYDDSEQHIMALFNVVGIEAIKKRFEREKPDPNKPLGPGISSKLQIVGGGVTYGQHFSDHPLFQGDALNGLIGSVTGRVVERAPDGRLLAVISVLSPYQHLAELNRLAGLEDYKFFSADEYVSVDPEKPTVFQNYIEGQLPPGQQATIMPGLPKMPLPFGFNFSVFTEAVGYFENNRFIGDVKFEYEYHLIRGRPSGIPQLDMTIAQSPPRATLKGSGTFVINTVSVEQK